MIIGITGTIGAGKGTISQYLSKKGFTIFSVRDFLVAELERRELPVNRDTMLELAESLRAEHGGSYLLDTLYEKAVAHGGNAVIESIRTVGEVESLKKKGMVLLAIDADPRVRYERIHIRGSATDDVTFEMFLAHEERESYGEDPSHANLKKTVALADFTLNNDEGEEGLYRQLDLILEKIS